MVRLDARGSSACSCTVSVPSRETSEGGNHGPPFLARRCIEPYPPPPPLPPSPRDLIGVCRGTPVANDNGDDDDDAMRKALTGVKKLVEDLDKAYASDPSLSYLSVDIALLEGAEGDPSKQDHCGPLYPVNTLRNLALLQVGWYGARRDGSL